MLLVTLISPFCFAGLFGDDVLIIKKSSVGGSDTNAQTACEDNEFLRGDGTCQTIASGFANPATTDLNMDGHSVFGAYDVNASHNFNVANQVNTAFLCDNFGVACIDMTGDPWWYSGNFRFGQDLWVDGNIFPFTTLWSNLGSGVNRWDNLFVRSVNTESLNATGDVNALTFWGDGSHLTGLNVGIDTNIYTAGILNPDTNAVMTDWNMNDNNIINVNYLKNEGTNINLTDTDIIINSDVLTINSAIANNGVYQSNLIPDSGDYNLGNTTNKWGYGYFDDNVNATNFVGNLDGNVKAMDVNTNALNVIAPTDISATTPLIHIENDTGGNIYNLFKLDVNKNGFRLYHGTKPTHMAGMDITSDPKNMANSATYIHGTSSGRIYFDCLTAAGAIGTCYSMEFTNIANFVDLPPRMLQNTSTTDTSMCSTGVACSSIGGTGTVDLAHIYQAVGYMSARGNQTTGQPAVKWRSFASDASSYNSQAYYSTYSYDTNAKLPYLTTLSHSKWLTAGVTKMTLTPDGNLSTAADINTATRFIAKNQIGIDKNMTVTQGAGTCDLNFIGGILIASTC